MVTGSCNLEYNVNKYLKRRTDKKVILFIAQGNKELFDYALDTCKIIRKRKLDNYLVYYKLHPGYSDWAEEFVDSSAEYSNIIRIYTAHDKSLYECLGEAEIQIAECSTGLYEGIAFGLKTYIIPSDGLEAIQPLIDIGYAKIINNMDEIFKSEKEEIFDIDLIWKRDAKTNTIREIKKLLQEI